MRKKAVIFAGAGASKAVKSDRFPTTVEFFDRLPETIRTDSLFSYVESYLRLTDSARTIDIEEILWEIQKLAKFARDVEVADGIVGYSLNADRLAHLIYNKQHTFAHLVPTLSNCASRSNDLIGDINASVYDFYNYEPEDEEISDNWLYLLGRLTSESWLFDIFTTNCDLVIESAASTVKKGKYERFLGLSGKIQKRIDISRWTTPAADEGLFTKLHGSINWQLGGDVAYVGAPVYTGDHKKQAIIYPGFKGQADSPLFGPMHAYLGDRLEAANLAIFVGFAFRDEHINRVIAERLGASCKVVVINPDKSVKFPIGRRRPKYIAAGFDRESISQALSK